MKESIAKLHNMCEDWKRELLFFKDELPVLRKRLDEIVSKNTAQDVLQEVEHFENKFKILGTHVDELLHDLTIKTDEINAQVATQSKYINVKMFDADAHLEDLMLTTSKDFHETKNSYYKFLAKVM